MPAMGCWGTRLSQGDRGLGTMVQLRNHCTGQAADAIHDLPLQRAGAIMEIARTRPHWVVVGRGDPTGGYRSSDCWPEPLPGSPQRSWTCRM